MSRQKPLARSRKPLKRGRVKPRNDARRKKEFARSYGSKARVEFVKSQRCLVSWCILRPSENAHLRTGGMGRKADANCIVALCAEHHRELHRVGPITFELLYRIALWDAASRLEGRWQAHRTAQSHTAGTPQPETR